MNDCKVPTVDPSICCLLEFMDNDLHNYIKEGTIKDPINIFSQIVCGLCFLHENNIIHTDLKPENILIKYPQNKVGEIMVKISDLDCVISPHNKETTRDLRTIWYRAPELFEESKRDYFSNKIDIWSLGCIFYEIFTGKPLFPTKNYNKLVKYIDIYKNGISDENRLKYFSKIPSQYEPLLLSMLKVNPEERPTAEQILLDLKKLYNKGKLYSLCDKGKSKFFKRPKIYDDIDNENRKTLITFLRTLIQTLEINKQKTVYKYTVNLLDKYWFIKKDISTKKLSIVGCACLIIICKLFSVSVDIDDLIYITEYIFTQKEIDIVECDIVYTLKFRIYINYIDNKIDILKMGEIISLPEFVPRFTNIIESNEEDEIY